MRSLPSSSPHLQEGYQPTMLITSQEGVPTDISFIVIAYNEEKYLPICLQSIVDQKTSLVGEIIVVDDYSTDSTAEIAKRFNARVFSSEQKGNVPGMRNLGMAQARGTAVLFVDSDVALSPNFAEKMGRPIIDSVVDVTLCPLIYPLETRFRVYPDGYSRSYAWCLAHFPSFIWGQIPIRIGKMLKEWRRKNREETSGHVSLLSIPDRVHTTGIMVRASIPPTFGGWHKPLGMHNDTEFCNNVFAQNPRVRWIPGAKLYISRRRFFPTGNEWILPTICKPILAPLRKWLGLKKKNEWKIRDQEKGYLRPEGRR
ncbi:MAG TPA: glycosyltransferase [Armatimonadota bacterium]|nr:glycosyltransferase [Armatimonadota bacterium]